MKTNDPFPLMHPVPTMARLLRIKSTGEIVRFMRIKKSEFSDPNQTVTVRSLERKTFEVPYRDTTAADDKEFLEFCKKWPESEWDFPKAN